MRLIDADALTYCNYDLDNYFPFRAVPEEAIEAAPTIKDVQKVVHGRWIVPYCHCSICGQTSSRQGNYCDNCGAKMDGEDRENE